MPAVAASADITTASSSTDEVTCRRPAPRARSSASSRLRWATRIVKVLTMMKPPTITAMIANTSRKVEITSRNWPIGVLGLLRDLVAGDRLEALGCDRVGGRGQLLLGDALGRGERDLVERVVPVQEDLLGALGAEHQQRGARSAAAVELGGADQRRRALGLAERREQLDLVAQLVVAVLGGASSRTISSVAVGHRPLLSTIGGSPAMLGPSVWLKASVGAPVPPTRVPSEASRLIPMPTTSPSARATSGSSSSSSTSSGERVRVVCVGPASKDAVCSARSTPSGVEL